jgi:ATP-dependent RNA helicase DeaD
VALSGELTQTERTHALQAMRDGRARVCVATDVAARGIDLPKLDLVIHAELPSNADTLLHRSGRTGRAGRKGISALIVPPKARRKAEGLLRTARVSAEWDVPPSADAVIARDEERLLADPMWSDPVAEGERAFVARLTGRFSPEQIAAAFLRQHRARQSAPEDLSPPDARDPGPRPASAFGPGAWFALSVGRNDRAEARWILPMLCRAGDIGKEDIGAIRIQPDETWVEILASSVPRFLSAIGPGMTLDKGATLRPLDGPPEAGRVSRDAPAKRPTRAPRPSPSDGGDAPADAGQGADAALPSAPAARPAPAPEPAPEAPARPDRPARKPRAVPVPAPVPAPVSGPRWSPDVGPAPDEAPRQSDAPRPAKAKYGKPSFDRAAAGAAPGKGGPRPAYGKPAYGKGPAKSGTPDAEARPERRFKPRNDGAPGGPRDADSRGPKKGEGRKGEAGKRAGPEGAAPRRPAAPAPVASDPSQRFNPAGDGPKTSAGKRRAAAEAAARKTAGKPGGKPGASGPRGKPPRGGTGTGNAPPRRPR